MLYEESVPYSIEGEKTFYVVTTGDDVIANYRHGVSKPERRLLKTKHQLDDRVIRPQQVDLQNGWTPPFFYEDRQHVFYVTTDEELVTVSEWKEYPSPTAPPSPKMVFIIPPLVYKEFNATPNPIDPIITNPNREDSLFKWKFNTAETVLFDNAEIDATGNLKLNQKQ